jgi:FkbM family methyltransferase
MVDSDPPPPSPATSLKPCRHGKMLFLKHDTYVGRSLDAYGEWSELECKVFGAIVRKGDIVVEAGSNVGAHTIQLAKLVGPAGKIVAFEPQRLLFQILCANLALNEMFNCYAYQAAVGSAAGILKVPQLDLYATQNFASLSLGHAGEGMDVPVIALDSLDLPSLRFLKADVEGMEIEVLQGARRTIEKHRPILYLENDRRENSPALITLVFELGYDIYWDAPPIFNPNNFNGNADNIFKNTVSINIVCIPRDRREFRIEGSRPVTSPTDWFDHRAG